MYVVHKLSSPGWKKPASSYQHVYEILIENVCNECLSHPDFVHIIDGKVINTMTVEDILSTSCGIEFEVVDGKDID